jgi:hypothetical protein
MAVLTESLYSRWGGAVEVVQDPLRLQMHVKVHYRGWTRFFTVDHRIVYDRDAAAIMDMLIGNQLREMARIEEVSKALEGS